MTLYLFQGATDGSYPNGGLVLDAFGTLYGTTVETTDRVYGGLVYELSPGGGSTWTESVLHSFASTGGAFPSGALVSDAAGNLYGTTSQGGSSAGVCMLFLDQGTGCGAAFKLTYSPDGSWSYSEIYDFTGIGTDGAGPKASLIFDSLGNLYGVTGAGGGNGLGTVFQLAPRPSRGWIHTTLYSLDVSWQNGVDPDTALLIDAAGNLFGVTPWGGKASGICGGCGVVFELSPTSTVPWTISPLHAFTRSTDGGEDYGYVPTAALVADSAGNFYGTAPLGGMRGCGVAFQLSPGTSGWTYSVINSFGPHGCMPVSPLTMDREGNLYGSTMSGGSHNEGIVFRLTPSSSGWSEEVLYAFKNQGDGASPLGALTFDQHGNLFGVTLSGGLDGHDRRCPDSCSVVFSLTPTPDGQWRETVVHTFPANSRALWGNMQSGLILGPNGHLFGTIRYGGTAAEGMVYEIIP